MTNPFHSFVEAETALVTGRFPCFANHVKLLPDVERMLIDANCPGVCQAESRRDLMRLLGDGFPSSLGLKR